MTKTRIEFTPWTALFMTGSSTPTAATTALCGSAAMSPPTPLRTPTPRRAGI